MGDKLCKESTDDESAHDEVVPVPTPVVVRPANSFLTVLSGSDCLKLWDALKGTMLRRMQYSEASE
eukprot:gene359-1783_t